MTIFDDLSTAMDDYPSTSIDLEIINVQFPGVLNEQDEGSFDIRITNRGPLNLTDVLFKAVGKNGTLVRGLGAASVFANSNVFGLSNMEVAAHNGVNPLVGGKFKPTRPSSTVRDLFEVTLETWNASWDHILISHSDPSTTPVATYSSTVAPR